MLQKKLQIYAYRVLGCFVCEIHTGHEQGPFGMGANHEEHMGGHEQGPFGMGANTFLKFKTEMVAVDLKSGCLVNH